MAYQKKWGGTHPGCLILLLDQSGSMKRPFSGKNTEYDHKKCDIVAAAVNQILFEIVTACQKGTKFSSRADIAVIGYGGTIVQSVLPLSIRDKKFVSILDLQQNPLRIESRQKERFDDTGESYIETVHSNIWVEPVAVGETPMCKALEHANILASNWAATHINNFPPVVINTTDGHASDGDPLDIFNKLMRIQTNDGNLLLFNCHITDKWHPPVEFPSSDASLPDDFFAQMLYNCSSEIPDETRTAYLQATSNELTHGSRGYIFNGDANSVRKMLVFGSTAASKHR